MVNAYEEVMAMLGVVMNATELRRISDAAELGHVEEIRLRAGRQTQVVFLAHDALVDFVPDARFMERAIDVFCEHSVYAREGEIGNGFITLPSGCRVGLCGRAVETGAGVSRMVDISGMNIRIAREVTGCARALIPQITDAYGRVLSTLLLSAPGVGKTTVLRDAARLLSNGGCGAAPHKVCIADERGELAAMAHGVPRMDVGERTDVMEGQSKGRAMRTMIRAMSPQVIVTDELGGHDDAAAVAEAVRCGVRVLASVHADSVRELYLRPSTEALMRDNAFTKLVRLFRRNGEVEFAVAEGEARHV